MKLDQTSGSLRAFGERLFALVEELAGAEPREIGSGGWYRARSEAGVFLYFRFTSKRARKYPPGAVHLAARWDPGFGDVEGVEQGNNWFGSDPSADLAAHPDSPEDVARAERFVRRAFELRRKTARRPAP